MYYFYSMKKLLFIFLFVGITSCNSQNCEDIPTTFTNYKEVDFKKNLLNIKPNDVVISIDKNYIKNNIEN